MSSILVGVKAGVKTTSPSETFGSPELLGKNILSFVDRFREIYTPLKHTHG